MPGQVILARHGLKKMLNKKYFSKGFSKKDKGFSLVELLVVVAIIAILVTLVLIAINPLRVIREAQDARRRSDLQAIRTSLQLYYNDNQAFPPTGSLNLLEPNYIRKLPKDPSSGSDYTYQSFNSNANYIAGTALAADTASDPDGTVDKCSSIGTLVGMNYVVCND